MKPGIVSLLDLPIGGKKKGITKATTVVKGNKKLTLLKCNNYKQKNEFQDSMILTDNCLFVLKSSFGLNVITQLRNAFCHNDIRYNQISNQYHVGLTNKIKIAGTFKLEAIREFVDAFLQTNQLEKENIK